MEVTKDKAKPFIVKANGMDVQVIGTSFNINSYLDEKDIRATLIDGSVRVEDRDRHASVLLKPNQQAIITKNGTMVSPANIAQTLAWKNGIINFQDKSLQEVMRQIARWYNIEVVYEGKIPDLSFIGEIGRDVNLSSVLNFLEQSGVNFKMEEGQKLVVLPSSK